MPLTDPQRSLIGKIGIETRLRSEDRQEMTRAAREQANWQRYYDQTDPGLSHEERTRQAESLRREHMARMTLASIGKPRKRRRASAPICSVCGSADHVDSFHREPVTGLIGGLPAGDE